MLTTPRFGQRGVTLIETMITLAILGMLIAMAVPVAGNWLLNSQIRTASESLQNGLQEARNEAARRNLPVEFILTAGSGWRVRLATPVAGISDPLLERMSAEGSRDAIVVADPAGATTVTFDGLGRRMVTNRDGSNPLVRACIDLPTTVLPAAESRDLQLGISLSGQVRMCDPKVGSSTDTRYCEDRATSPCTGR